MSVCPNCKTDTKEPNHFCPTCLERERWKKKITTVGRYDRKTGRVIYDY